MDEEPPWPPEESFYQFLKTIPLRGETAKAIGRRFIREMRSGSDVGRKLYEDTYKHDVQRYRVWLATRDQPMN